MWLDAGDVGVGVKYKKCVLVLSLTFNQDKPTGFGGANPETIQ